MLDPVTTRDGRKTWMSNGYSVFLGLDVGKGTHHAVGLDVGWKRLHNAPLPNTEPKLRAVFDKLAKHGPLLVVVDQPATIGALPVAVARASGHQVAYLPGLAMCRIADLYPGHAKTDARDAFIMADAARTAHGHQARRRHHDRAQRADGHCSRHRSRGHRAAPAGHEPENRAPPTQTGRQQGQKGYSMRTLLLGS
jgi:hypothetical protein